MKICDGMGITMAQFFSEGESVGLTDEQREWLEWYNSLNAQGKERVTAYVKGGEIISAIFRIYFRK